MKIIMVFIVLILSVGCNRNQREEFIRQEEEERIQRDQFSPALERERYEDATLTTPVEDRPEWVKE